MSKLIGTLLALTVVLGPNTTSWGQDDAGDAMLIPGQRVFKAATYQGALDIVERLEAYFGDGTVSIVNQANRLQIYTVKFPPPQTDEAEDVVQNIFADEQDSGQIIWNEPNRLINAHGQTGSLWVSGLGIDAASYQSQYALETINVNRAHQSLSRGRGTLVAVIDTGIAPTHPALAGKVSDRGYNAIVNGGGTDDSGDGVHAGHGTFIAGLVALVAPEARLLPVTALRPDGTGFPVDIADGIDHAVTEGAHVIVLALGTTAGSNAMRTAIDAALANGITVVAAAGNTLPTPTEPSILFPASYSGIFGGNIGVFAVGASTHLDDLAPFSNYHASIDAYAPGSSGMLPDGSPDPATSIIGPLPDGSYAAANGTSFSTAFVGGLAALVRAQEREWPDQNTSTSNIPVQLHARMLEADTYVVMPVVPANPIPDKPRVNAVLACQYGKGLTPQGDIDGDGYVTGADLTLLLGSWGVLPANGSLHGANLSPDDTINGADLSLLLGNWLLPEG